MGIRHSLPFIESYMHQRTYLRVPNHGFPSIIKQECSTASAFGPLPCSSHRAPQTSRCHVTLNSIVPCLNYSPLILILGLSLAPLSTASHSPSLHFRGLAVAARSASSLLQYSLGCCEPAIGYRPHIPSSHRMLFLVITFVFVVVVVVVVVQNVPCPVNTLRCSAWRT
jgi:hypothetical protein